MISSKPYAQSQSYPNLDVYQEPTNTNNQSALRPASSDDFLVWSLCAICAPRSGVFNVALNLVRYATFICFAYIQLFFFSFWFCCNASACWKACTVWKPNCTFQVIAGSHQIPVVLYAVRAMPDITSVKQVPISDEDRKTHDLHMYWSELLRKFLSTSFGIVPVGTWCEANY